MESPCFLGLLPTILKFCNKLLSGHCLSNMYFSNLDHFYWFLNHLQVSSFLLQVVAPRTEYNLLSRDNYSGAGDIIAHWNRYVYVEVVWVWSYIIWFPGIVPLLICLAFSQSLNNLHWKQFPQCQMGIVIPSIAA